MRFGWELLRVLLLLVTALIASAAAQNAHTNTNTAQAQLQLSVYLVPTVFSPAPPVQNKAVPVTYNLPRFVPQQESTVQQTAIVSLNDHSLCENQHPCRATLLTTTVVPR